MSKPIRINNELAIEKRPNYWVLFHHTGTDELERDHTARNILLDSGDVTQLTDVTCAETGGCFFMKEARFKIEALQAEAEALAQERDKLKVRLGDATPMGEE